MFEDHPINNLDENIHVPFKNAHSTIKRSIGSDDRELDVQELMDGDVDADEHWLWGPVKRIRRSIDKLLGTENPSDVNESTERQPKHHKKTTRKYRKKVLNSGGEKRKIWKNDGKMKGAPVGSKKMTMRPKRQDYDEFDDDEDEEEDDEILEPISSGSSSLPEIEVPEKEDRLCEYYFN